MKGLLHRKGVYQSTIRKAYIDSLDIWLLREAKVVAELQVEFLKRQLYSMEGLLYIKGLYEISIDFAFETLYCMIRLYLRKTQIVAVLKLELISQT